MIESIAEKIEFIERNQRFIDELKSKKKPETSDEAIIAQVSAKIAEARADLDTIARVLPKLYERGATRTKVYR